MKFAKKFLALVLAVTMGMSLFVSASADEGTTEAFDEYTRPVVKETLKVGYLIGRIEAESNARSLQQAQIECAHRGWELIECIMDGDSQFRDTFQNLMNQGVDTIIIGNMMDMDAKADLIVEARNAGIGVYNNDNQLVSGIISNVTMPNGVAAMMLAYELGADSLWDMNIGVIQDQSIQVHHERTSPVIGLLESAAYPNFNLLAQEDVRTSESSYSQVVYDYTQAWLLKYGEELDCVFTTWDGLGFSIAEAISQMGDTTGENTKVVAFDGGSDAWAYVRNNTPFQMTYSQPFELFTHTMFEIINQIQVEGMNPGDEGCIISKSGDTVYNDGIVTTRKNCPEIGANIHEVFDYYGGNPDDPDAWYNWTDGPGIYTVTDGTAAE